MALKPQVRGDGSAGADVVPLPARYATVWDEPFRDAVSARLKPGLTILDVGSGRNPTIPADERPDGTTYVGLDVSAAELAQAGPGAYDESVVADIGSLQQGLVGRVDIIVSWQVLEHVSDMGAAMGCMRAYLRPGGTLISMFSASGSAFALVNRVVPFHIGAPIVKRVMGRSSTNPVFPAYYDHCTASEIRELLTQWSDVSVQPFFAGARYFNFSAYLTRVYLKYENRIADRGSADRATHYLLVATR